MFIVIEAADMLLPAGDGDITKLNDVQLHRIAITQDWFSDPEFVNAGDCVVLLAESASQIHRRVSGVPQVMSVAVDAPTK